MLFALFRRKPVVCAASPLTPTQAMCVRQPRDAATAVARLGRQTLEGWKPRPDLGPFQWTPGFDWTSDPFTDANWRFQINAWRPLDALMAAHHLAGSLPALRQAVAIMLDWAAFERESSRRRLLWNDMSTGIRAAKLAYVLAHPDFHRLGARTRVALEGLARRHLEQLRDPLFISRSNHAIAQIQGAMALCRVRPGWPEAQGGDGYVRDILVGLLHDQFGHEGLHLEHSPAYHFFGLREFTRLHDSGWYDHVPELGESLDRAHAAAPWLLFPDGLMSAIGDSSAKRRTEPPPAFDTEFAGRLFREAGYAVIRRKPGLPARRSPMLTATCAHHGGVHKHADELSFEMFELGRRLFVDTGKYTYNNRGPWRPFTNSARAHNTIDVLDAVADNGLSTATPAGGGFTSLRQTRWGWTLSGAYARPEHGFAHRRQFLYRPAHWLILLDEVSSDRERAPTAWLHLDPELEAERDGDGWRFPGGDIAYVADHPLDLTRARGAEDPIQGWIATDYHMKVENDALGARWTGPGVGSPRSSASATTRGPR